MKSLYFSLFLIAVINYSNLHTAEPMGKLYIQNSHAKLQFLCNYSVAGREKGPVTVYQDPVYLGLVSQVSDVQVSRYGQLLGAYAKFYSYKDQLDICKTEPDKDWSLLITGNLSWGITAQQMNPPKIKKYALEFFGKAYQYYTQGSKLEPRYMFDLGDTYNAAAVDENKARKIEQAIAEGLDDDTMATVIRLAEISAQAAKELLGIRDKTPIQYHQAILKWQDQLFPDRIEEGRRFACDILRGQGVPNIGKDSYLQNIINVMWFLYSRAVAKNQAFDEGTFIIQDEQHRLYDYLMNYVKLVNPYIKGTLADPETNMSLNPYAYSRASSHFIQEQKSTAYNGRHYGIDIRFQGEYVAQALLPAQKSHVLFSKIADNLIFIKFENVGLAPQSAMYHGAEFVAAQARKKNDALSKYLEETFLKTIPDTVQYYLGSDDDPTYRKERTPRDFVNTCRIAAIAGRLSPEQIESFVKLAMSKGIHGVLAEIDGPEYPLAQHQKDALKKYIIELEAKEGLDYQHIRYGREVILMQQDLLGPCQ